MKKNHKICVAFILLFCFVLQAKEDETIKADIPTPYERPLGFTLNILGLTSLTYEGRFFVGLAPHVVLVLLPSFQRTLELPFYDFTKEEWNAFHIMRAHLGVGVRGHFYYYDSWDGFFIEGMVRPGMVWAGKDPFKWSVIPSVILGYQTVYESGYTISFGVGVEWEFLLGKPKKESNLGFLQNAYKLTKLPLTGDFSIGWSW